MRVRDTIPDREADGGPKGLEASLAHDAARWELLVIALVFVGTIVARQTGSFPGDLPRVLDDILIAIVLVVLSLRVGVVSRRFSGFHLVIAATAVILGVVDAVGESDEIARSSTAFFA